MVSITGQSFRLFTLLVILSQTLSLSTGLLKNLRHRIIAEKRATVKNRLDFQGTQLPPETVVGLHDDVMLYCEASGSPPPTIHWLKDGERIIQGSSHDVRDDEARFEEKVSKTGIPRTGVATVRSSLYIDCAGSRDNGVYTCVADTPYNRISNSTALVIEEGLDGVSNERCFMKKAYPGVPARIYMWTGARIENQGTNVQLFCRSEGYPFPAITWRDRNNKIITNSDKYKILKNGDLLIMNLNWADNFGSLTCQVNNESGQDEKKVVVYPVRPSIK